MTVQEWLGQENQLGIDIWSGKYQYENETFEEWLDRVSNGDAELRQVILSKKFLFGGRILSNRGLHKKGVKSTYSNCYVISPPEDNIESIYECAKKLARTFSYGGGCGVDISKLAPKGAKVNNTAKETSGAVSFMDLYNLTTALIGQNGRRGALMLSISCDHPDLEEFINIKTDLNKINKANISIRITDEFMEAVKENKPYTLSFTRNETGETVSKEVNAREIFRRACETNWDYGEPGMLFWDRIENWNLLSADPNFEYAGTNPCLTGDTLISTVNGEIPIEQLVGQTPYVYCMDENGELAIRQASKVWKTRENAEIVLVETRRGCIKCTPDHLIHTRNRGWVPARQLQQGDRITGLNRMMKDETHVAVGLSGGKYTSEHRFVASAFFDIEGKDIHHIDGNTLNNTIDNLAVLDHSIHSRITNTGRKILSIRDNKGRYLKKSEKSKRNSFNLNCGVGTNWMVCGVYQLEETVDVYDMTVPGVHNFVANRMVVHNCAEEPLPAGGSCLLGSINLAEFVVDGNFDFEDFAHVVHVAVRALNDVLDEGLELHPLEEQRNSVRDWRQIGLGIFGLADALIKMELTYGSSDSIDLCKKIAKTMIQEAVFMSSKLAKDYGAYPNFNSDYITDSDFFYSNITEDIKRYVCAYGLRNSQLLTIAPTGSLSNLLGVSGGIEPIFANYYARKTESLHKDEVYYKVYTPIVKEYMDKNNITDDADLPGYFITARDIYWKDRIRMQAVWQDYIDASISSTVNVPNEFTVEDTMALYQYAWSRGLKGVTIFRDGCKRGAVLVDSKSAKKEEEKKEPELDRGDVIKVSDDCVGKKRTLHTGCGTLHCEAFFDPNTGDLLETYLSKGSSGGCNNFMIGLSRLISLAARGGISVDKIVDQLRSSGTCPSYAVRTATKHDTSKGSSCPVAISYALMDMYQDMQNELSAKNAIKNEESNVTPKAEANDNLCEYAKCPVCGDKLVFEGGCNTCKSCGWSKCD